MKPNSISLHASAAGRANLRTYIRAAQAAGHDCIEPTKTQLNDFLNAGYRPEHIRSLLGPLEITSVGWLSDLDRHGSAFTGMMHEAEALFSLAASVGSHAVEIINGPTDWHAVYSFRHGLPYDGYMGLQGMPEPMQNRIMVQNLRALADLAAEFGLILFFEPLCWTPIPSLREGIPLVEEAERGNLKIVVDFYHNYIAGLDAEFLSHLRADLIYGVHVCNAREPDGGIPCEEVYRDVDFHGGRVPLREWVDAIRTTGYRGWWTYETFSRREAEEEVYAFARYVHTELTALLGI